VNIRPLGDLSPGVADFTLSTSTLRIPASLSARDFRRPHTSADKPFVNISPTTPGTKSIVGGGVMGTRSISVSTAPLVPIRGPPILDSILYPFIFDPPNRPMSSRRSTHLPICPSFLDSVTKFLSCGDFYNHRRCVSGFTPDKLVFHLIQDEFSKTLGIKDETNEESNPFGLLKRDEATPTPKLADSWEAIFKTSDDTNETYDRLIDLQDDSAEVKIASKPSQAASAVPKDSDELFLYSICYAPLADIEDDDTSTPSPPPPPQTLHIPRFSTESRALPPPIPPLPIAIALTETWRAQFPNGGGSSFTTTERPAQSLFGQVTLAVAREDLRLLTHSQISSLKPLILIFSRAQRMHDVQAAFSGVSIL
ncbi:unnamed protein product, partial [Taenia asiatica]|uniref:AGC-kinase C-terminal domain-containing protein n=1 Tax=Taenia asiatica TaxID=60517 RepID=A0A0R3VXS2_TAEAS